MLLRVDYSRFEEMDNLPQALHGWSEEWRREHFPLYKADMIQRESSSLWSKIVNYLTQSLFTVSTRDDRGSEGSKSSGERNSPALLTPIPSSPSTTDQGSGSNLQQEQQSSLTGSFSENPFVVQVVKKVRQLEQEADQLQQEANIEEAEARKRMAESRRKMQEAEDKSGKPARKPRKRMNRSKGAKETD
ncbi:hypothetical protein QBC41DRAFT_335789 [Cercophora samala]|uniref:Uncharacterized protein n=1 Tax=Cercophora samala TaxID=330535 RepID=A0AA39ZGR9_9PEZI|nr:hypothetical protein QBC41DRAFT_335789 [Cercophora samala]